MRVSYKRQELLALRGRLDSPPVFVGVRVAYRFSFLWCSFIRMKQTSYRGL